MGHKADASFINPGKTHYTKQELQDYYQGSAKRFNEIIEDRNNFSILVANVEDMVALIRQFPASKKILLEHLIVDNGLLENICPAPEQLNIILNEFSDSVPYLMEALKMRSSEVWFQMSRDDFIHAITSLPILASEFWETLLADGLNRSNVISSIDDLIMLSQSYPEYRDDLLAKILVNEKILKRIAYSMPEVKKLVQFFPEYSAQIWEAIFIRYDIYKVPVAVAIDDDEENFYDDSNERFDSDWQGGELGPLEALKVLTQMFPEYSQDIFNVVDRNREVYQQLATNYYNFIELAEIFPEHAKALVGILLTPTGFSNIIDSSYALEAIVEALPKYSQDIFNFLHRNAEIYQQLVDTDTQFVELVKIFPEHKKTLVELLLKPAEFLRLVDSSEEFFNIVEALPEYSQDLLSFLNTHREIYQKLEMSRYALIDLAENFPECVKTLLEILLTPTEFSRIVHSYDAFDEIAKALPMYKTVLLATLLALPSVNYEMLETNDEMLEENVETLEEKVKAAYSYGEQALDLARIIKVKDAKALNSFRLSLEEKNAASWEKSDYEAVSLYFCQVKNALEQESDKGSPYYQQLTKLYKALQARRHPSLLNICSKVIVESGFFKDSHEDPRHDVNTLPQELQEHLILS